MIGGVQEIKRGEKRMRKRERDKTCDIQDAEERVQEGGSAKHVEINSD